MTNYMNLIWSIAFICLGCAVSAQSTSGNIMGKVLNEQGEPAFVSVYLDQTTYGTFTDEQGHYVIKNIPQGSYFIIIEGTGYEKIRKSIRIDSLDVELDFRVKTEVKSLGEIVVSGTLNETYIKNSPIKVEVITKEFLNKNPVNNVMEAIQTVNGIQEQINCGVCATNDIHINGLEGPYTLVLIDGMPIMSALASVYGFNGIPTSLIERIEIIKGPSSTLYGSEAVGGLINIITIRPEKMPSLQLNTFYTSHREWNLDLAVSPHISPKVKTLVSTNFYRNQYRMDFNKDNFTDIPLNTRLSLFNKYNFIRKKNRLCDIALRYYSEDRFGGTMQWQPEFRGSDSVYGESIKTIRWEILGTYQLPFEKEFFRIDYSLNSHNQDSYYGNTSYKADQSTFFANFIWTKSIYRNQITSGTTLRYETYSDNSPASISDKRLIPGIFIQDEWRIKNRTTLLGGTRMDYHSAHGLIFSPRFNVKRNFGELLIARLNLGTGFRNVNLFTEDHAALTGSRTVLIRENLLPERSYNATVNFNYTYLIKKMDGVLDLDFFYTYFSNKIIPDYETDPNLIIYSNLDGYGISRGISFSIQHSFLFPLKLQAGATFQDVYQVVPDAGETAKEPQLFAPKLSGTFVIGYQFINSRISIDYTGRIMGPQHLPTFPEPFSRAEISPWYTIQNLQITKEFRSSLQVYAGIKNIFNWTQTSPLIDPANPFGPDFDTSYAWGPLQQRRYFIGLRYKILKTSGK